MFDQQKVAAAREQVDWQKLRQACKNPPVGIILWRFKNQPGGQHVEYLTEATAVYTLRTYLRGKMHMVKKRVPMCISGGATIIEVTAEDIEQLALKELSCFSNGASVPRTP